jgi:sirohydrochlorin cobaltochelatase
VEQLVKDGVEEITVVSSMFTPGGSHSEVEIPQTLEQLRKKHSGVIIRYAWPFDRSLVAAPLAAQIKRFS